MGGRVVPHRPLRSWLADLPAGTLLLGLIAAFAAGLLLGFAIMGLGWWEAGAAWERDALFLANRTVNRWLDPVFLILPLFGTNYTLVPLVALAIVWFWRPPGRIGSVVAGLLGGIIGGGAVQAVYGFVLGDGAPVWLMLMAAVLGAGVVVAYDAGRAARPVCPLLALHLAVVQLGSWILNPALKFSLSRPRPQLFELRGQFDFPAYPSGHSIAVTSVLVTAAYLVHKTGHGTWAYWAVGVFFLLNSYSRIYLGVHWPTDVIGGTLVGGIWLAATLLAFRRAERGVLENGLG